MKIPKKITPDFIRDSFVEIRFASEYPFEVTLGIFVNAFEGTDFQFATKLPTANRALSKEQSELEKLFTLSTFFLYNDKIKIQFQPGTIIFNCLEDYVNWQNYMPLIQDSMQRIQDSKVVHVFERVGLRYINEFKGYDLNKILNFSIPFTLENHEFRVATSKIEFNSDGYRVNVGVTSHPVVEGESKSNLLDIDVFRSGLNITKSDELFPIIETCHVKEKTVFFSLLNPEFLSSLNPEY